MSIRNGVFIVGQTVQIYGSFTDTSGALMTDAGGFKVTIKRPDGTVTDHVPPSANGQISMDILANQVGNWYIRLECATPSIAVMEGKFLVVGSSVVS